MAKGKTKKRKLRSSPEMNLSPASHKILSSDSSAHSTVNETIDSKKQKSSVTEFGKKNKRKNHGFRASEDTRIYGINTKPSPPIITRTTTHPRRAKVATNRYCSDDGTGENAENEKENKQDSISAESKLDDSFLDDNFQPQVRSTPMVNRKVVKLMAPKFHTKIPDKSDKPNLTEYYINKLSHYQRKLTKLEEEIRKLL